MPRSVCGSAQSHPGLHYSLIASFDRTECMKGQPRPGRYFMHAQEDVMNLSEESTHIRMSEGIFSLDSARIV